MAAKQLDLLLLSMLLAIAPISAIAEDPGTAMPDPGSQVLGKGGGMGKSYQQNVTGPGQGAPENRGSAAGANSGQQKPANEEQAESADAQKEQVKTQTQSQEETQSQHEIRSQKARDGSGYGAGPGGERGLGSEGAPHHKQYGNPSRGSGK